MHKPSRDLALILSYALWWAHSFGVAGHLNIIRVGVNLLRRVGGLCINISTRAALPLLTIFPTRPFCRWALFALLPPRPSGPTGIPASIPICGAGRHGRWGHPRRTAEHERSGEHAMRFQWRTIKSASSSKTTERFIHFHMHMFSLSLPNPVSPFSSPYRQRQSSLRAWEDSE